MGSCSGIRRERHRCKFHLSEILTECVEFCKWQFEFNGNHSGGATQKEHLEAAAENPFAALLGEEQKIQASSIDTTPPSLPASAQFAWSYFLRLNQTRQVGGLGGFCSISYQEMLAFFTLEGTTPESYELELIRVWDKIALEHFAKEQKHTNAKK